VPRNDLTRPAASSRTTSPSARAGSRCAWTDDARSYNVLDDVSITLAEVDDCTNSCATPSYTPTRHRLALKRSEHVKKLLRRLETAYAADPRPQ